MKISDPSSGPVSGVSQASGRASNRPSGTERRSSTGDQIELSQLGAQLSESNSSERGAKISDLAAAVSGGRYQVDANAVSDNIIQHSLVLGRAA
jgi:flagellar biosynthesis anti-sigma factor FlgM